MRRFAGCFTLSLLLAACWQSEEGGGPSADSNTNWLMACDVDDECGDSACLCGQCTVACDVESDCGDLRGARCTMASDHDPCMVTAQVAPVCLLECEGDRDCGDFATCQRGHCVPERVPESDGVVDGGMLRDGGADDTARDGAATDADMRETDVVTDRQEDDCLSGCRIRGLDAAACEALCAPAEERGDTDVRPEDDAQRLRDCVTGCEERSDDPASCDRMCAAEESATPTEPTDPADSADRDDPPASDAALP